MIKKKNMKKKNTDKHTDIIFASKCDNNDGYSYC